MRWRAPYRPAFSRLQARRFSGVSRRSFPQECASPHGARSVVFRPRRTPGGRRDSRLTTRLCSGTFFEAATAGCVVALFPRCDRDKNSVPTYSEIFYGAHRRREIRITHPPPCLGLLVALVIKAIFSLRMRNLLYGLPSDGIRRPVPADPFFSSPLVCVFGIRMSSPYLKIFILHIQRFNESEHLL